MKLLHARRRPAPRPWLLLGLALAALMLGTVRPSAAADLHLAVAANYTGTMEVLAARFEAQTGHRLRVSYGSTGKLYAQIRHGAPFDVFLAADRRRPRLLEQQGLAVAGSRFTYARGRLALWSPGAVAVTGPETLRRGGFVHLAIANPKTAPYGLAAEQVLQHLRLWQSLRPRLVRGENIAQTFHYVDSGAAELGFVALAQLRGPKAPSGGSSWEVPEDLHAPIEQQAVLLRHGAANPAARAFLSFLKGAEAQKVNARFGYGGG